MKLCLIQTVSYLIINISAAEDKTKDDPYPWHRADQTEAQRSFKVTVLINKITSSSKDFFSIFELLLKDEHPRNPNLLCQLQNSEK